MRSSCRPYPTHPTYFGYCHPIVRWPPHTGINQSIRPANLIVHHSSSPSKLTHQFTKIKKGKKLGVLLSLSLSVLIFRYQSPLAFIHTHTFTSSTHTITARCVSHSSPLTSLSDAEPASSGTKPSNCKEKEFWQK